MKKAIGQLAMLAAGIAAYIFGKGVEGTLLNGALLVFGFVLLIKGADWFVESASKIADKLGIPQLIIGLTIVAFGTSAPEAAVSITAAIGGESVDIAIGNVLGSNIMNVLLILGLASIICPLRRLILSIPTRWSDVVNRLVCQFAKKSLETSLSQGSFC